MTSNLVATDKHIEELQRALISLGSTMAPYEGSYISYEEGLNVSCSTSTVAPSDAAYVLGRFKWHVIIGALDN